MPRTEHAVFAYGSNLDLPDLERWLTERGYPGLRPASVIVASLPDWELVWNYRSDVRRGGAANVAPSPGAVVWGAVLMVDDALLAALDRKEGHPGRYRRLQAKVSGPGDLEGGTAWVYVVTPPFLSAHRIPPTQAYLEVVLRGARALGLPADYLARLAQTETVSEDSSLS